MTKQKQFIYVGSDILYKTTKNKNVKIGTTGLCGCVGLGIIIKNKITLVSHILSDTSYNKLNILLHNILDFIKKEIGKDLYWKDFNNENNKLKFFSQNPDRTSGETFFNKKRISLEKLIYIYFEKEFNFNNFFIERCGCIGIGSPGFYIHKEIFYPYFEENLPLQDIDDI